MLQEHKQRPKQVLKSEMAVKMRKLNFPISEHKIAREDDHTRIFDVIRKKWVVLTPEEWVRQNLIKYLTDELGYPGQLITVEKSLLYNGMKRRSDLVVYDRSGNPLLIAECKAPEITVKSSTFDQAAKYNFSMRVPYLLITNGLNHYCCAFRLDDNGWTFLDEIPAYEELLSTKKA